jgi:outer membrane protein
MNIKTMSRYISISCLLFLAFTAYGQKTWTLDECIRQAINSNLQLEQTRIDNRIRHEELSQSRLELLPTFNGYLNADNSYGRSIDPSTNDIVSTQLFQASTSVSSSLVLFQGFVNLNRVQYNRLNVLKGSLTEATQKNDLAFKVMNAYFDLCFTKGQLQIAQDQCELSRLNLNKIKVMVDAGVKAKTDIADMEARLALDDFKVTQAESAVSKAKLTLQQLLNIRDQHSFEIENKVGLSNSEPKAIPDPDSVFLLATQHLPQFTEMKIDARLSRINYAIAKGGRLPNLHAQAGYGTGYYDTYRDANEDRIDFNNQLRNNAYQYIGLSMTLPLFNGWQVNRNIVEAKWNLAKTNTGIEIKKREFYIEIENACLSVRSAADEYQSASMQELATSLNLQLAEKKWEQGTGNLLELTDARNRLASARAEKLRTLLQYELKWKTIQIFTGELNF